MFGNHFIQCGISPSTICLPTTMLLIPLMACGLSAAQCTQELSRGEELAYKNAVATYEAEHHAYATSKSKAKRLCSLCNLAPQSNGLISVTTLSHQLKGLPLATDVAHTKLAKLWQDEEVLKAVHELTRGSPGSELL